MIRLIFSLVMCCFFLTGSPMTNSSEPANEVDGNKYSVRFLKENLVNLDIPVLWNDCLKDDISFKNKSAQIKVTPSVGSYQGGCNNDGYYVEISGACFGNGWDISSVTICGIEVCHIIMQSSNVVIVYPNSGTPGTGDIVITSKSMGKTTIENAFTYQVPTPNIQAKNIQYSKVGETSGKITWTRGSGESCIVFMKQSDSGHAEPSDYKTYAAGSVFGKGTEIEETGWHCVYNGSGTSVTVSGLKSGAAYVAQVFEYNGQTGFENYLISTSADNLGSHAPYLSFVISTEAIGN